MSGSAPDPDDGQGRPPRLVEHDETVVELTAAVVVRQADGWELLNAGHVTADRLWGEFERAVPDPA